MAIERIDTDNCIGCGECVLSCPMDVLRMDEKTGKAMVVYPEDCQICCFCMNHCPVGTTALIITPYQYMERLAAWS
jgi:NAD-dependent dihydropyrimidine dehydrogenase PreA subunit